jgi:hypothetical protein
MNSTHQFAVDHDDERELRRVQCHSASARGQGCVVTTKTEAVPLSKPQGRTIERNVLRRILHGWRSRENFQLKCDLRHTHSSILVHMVRAGGIREHVNQTLRRS